MTVRLNKQDATTLAALCNQAQLSIHRALSNPNQWHEFQAFYNASKRANISKMLSVLEDCGALRETPRKTPKISRSFMHGVFVLLPRMLINRLKSTWAFSDEEVSFCYSLLAELRQLIDAKMPAPQEQLIEFRHELVAAYFMCANKLVGIPELQQVNQVEHFHQSENQEHFGVQEIHVPSGEHQTTSRSG